MAYPLHDAIVEFSGSYARLRALTPPARCWVEAHVTLAQVSLWTNDILEVPPPAMSDLITAMLRAGLKLVPASGKMVIYRTQIGTARGAPCVSPH
jgi:hypothetical protein